MAATVDVVRRLTTSEHDFVRVLVELIADRRDPAENVERQALRQRRQEAEARVTTLQAERARLLHARRRALLEDDADAATRTQAALASVEAELATATDLASVAPALGGGDALSALDTTLMPVEDDVRSHLHCLAIARLLLERIHEVTRAPLADGGHERGVLMGWWIRGGWS
jgi:hypothetical protein